MGRLLKNKKRTLVYLLAGLTLLFVLFFTATSFIIGRDVKRLCLEAKRDYSGDCVEALITQLNDENQDFRARNHAVWALGQLGDSRALPTLQKYYTGNIPNREPLDGVISQYELKKAINLTSGGVNLTAVFWRHGID